MNCRKFEPLIALYAGRDLDDPTQVEEHLADCPACRELLEDLQSSQAELREWAPEPVDAALLASVRSGVLSKVEARRPKMWPWVAGLATAGTLALAFLATPPPVPEPPRPQPLVAQVPPAVVAKSSAPRHKRVVRQKAEPLVVKMLTDDPDIVIIWLSGD